MDVLPWLVAAGACVFSAGFCIRCRSDLAAAKKALPPGRTAAEILHDLTRGAALVKIERVDPSDVLLRSPRS
jgi:hypothetical protein